MNFLLEDALSSSASPSRRNEFTTFILETQLPGVHFNVDGNVDGNVELPAVTISPQSEDYMIAGQVQNMETWVSDKAAMKILAESLKGESSSTGEEENFVPGDPVSKELTHSHCLEFLDRNGPNFLLKNLDDKKKICSTLLEMAIIVKVLPPANEPLPWDILNMSRWKESLCELIKEMKTVEEMSSRDELCKPVVYVVTKSPYAAFLRALAAEIDDR